MKVYSISSRPEFWDDILVIFFETSNKTNFSCDKVKEEFIYKYLGYYKEKHPDLFLIATINDKVVGYICGSSDSKSDIELYSLLSHYKLFSDYFVLFPAHLHINISKSAQGLGLGSLLLKEFELKCKKPVHLITSPDALNRKFYRKNNYLFESIRTHQKHDLLFMGK